MVNLLFFYNMTKICSLRDVIIYCIQKDVKMPLISPFAKVIKLVKLHYIF